MKTILKLIISLPLSGIILLIIFGCSPKTCDVTIISHDQKISKQRLEMPLSLDTDQFTSMHIANCK